MNSSFFSADLVPVFSFGENDIYDQVENPEGSRLRTVQNWLKGKLGFSSPMFSGRGVFNYSMGILPFRKPINTVGKENTLKTTLTLKV